MDAQKTEKTEKDGLQKVKDKLKEKGKAELQRQGKGLVRMLISKLRGMIGF